MDMLCLHCLRERQPHERFYWCDLWSQELLYQLLQSNSMEAQMFIPIWKDYWERDIPAVVICPQCYAKKVKEATNGHP